MPNVQIPKKSQISGGEIWNFVRLGFFWRLGFCRLARHGPSILKSSRNELRGIGPKANERAAWHTGESAIYFRIGFPARSDSRFCFDAWIASAWPSRLALASARSAASIASGKRLFSAKAAARVLRKVGDVGAARIAS